MAINFDKTPGPDGFAVRVYASNGRTAEALPIKHGTLEIQLFDGAPTEAARATHPPLHVWSFDPRKLKAYAAKSSIGVGYRFALQWQEARPTAERFTVVVRYVAPTGTAVASSPSVIPMTLR